MIVAVNDFSYGRHGEQGALIFQRPVVYWRNADTCDRSGVPGVEAVVAHEYFHNLVSANRVTCRDWFQLCAARKALRVLPRFAVLRRHRLGNRQPRSKASSFSARQPVWPKVPAPWPHTRSASLPLSRFSNFYTLTVYREWGGGIRGGAHAAHAPGGRGLSQGYRPVFSKSPNEWPGGDL